MSSLNTLYVFTTDRWDLYAVVQSTLHEVWARKYSGALKQDLRYSPSNCFDTFAFPDGLWQTANPALAAIGERYHEHRRADALSLARSDRHLQPVPRPRPLAQPWSPRSARNPRAKANPATRALLELRRLHRELDLAIRDAYGWQDLDLGHDFHEVETLAENDRVRYTISPAARKEVLKRFLALNHIRAETEAATISSRPKRGRQSVVGGGEGHSLFSEES